MKKEKKNKIEYRKGNLFEQDLKGKILVHACNCTGRWGSGIAKEFHSRFPIFYVHYNQLCLEKGSSLLGQAQILGGPASPLIGNLFTSRKYGKWKDSEQQILESTRLAVDDLLKQLEKFPPRFQTIEIHSPKINSGLFEVDWRKTKKIIETALEGKPYKWIVWEL